MLLSFRIGNFDESVQIFIQFKSVRSNAYHIYNSILLLFTLPKTVFALRFANTDLVLLILLLGLKLALCQANTQRPLHILFLLTNFNCKFFPAFVFLFSKFYAQNQHDFYDVRVWMGWIGFFRLEHL